MRYSGHLFHENNDYFSVDPNQAFVRKPVEPIREANPWGDATNTNIVKSQTEPTFAAFQSVKQPMTSSHSFVQKTRGDAWMESITQEMTALKTGESIASTVSSIGTVRTAPAIPKRTGIAALPHFNRSQTQYQSMRSPQNNTTIQFTRSHSVRYVSICSNFSKGRGVSEYRPRNHIYFLK